MASFLRVFFVIAFTLPAGLVWRRCHRASCVTDCLSETEIRG
jgi:hypothetical protein